MSDLKISALERLDEEEPPQPAAIAELPGVDGYISIEVDDAHQIIVDVRCRRSLGYRIAGPERYVWKGGVPHPIARGIPDAGAYGPSDDAYVNPVQAALVAAKGKAKGKLSRDEVKLARATWLALWSVVAKRLDQRVARLAHRYGFPARLYTMLVARPDLCDHIEICPGLGPLLTESRVAEIPERGWNLERVAQHLLAGTGSDLPSLGPGFMEWARRFDPESTMVPHFPPESGGRSAGLRAIVRNAAAVADRLDPNGVRKLGTGEEWLLMNSALANEATRHYAPLVLKDPAAALNRVLRHYPEDMRELSLADGRTISIAAVPDRILRVLGAINEYEAIEPENVARADSLSGLLKRVGTWERAQWPLEMRQATDRAQELAARRAAKAEAMRLQMANYERLMADVAMHVRGRQHAHAYRLDTRYAEFIGTDYQFPFLPPPERRSYREGDVEMVPITNFEELQWESVEMHHCVVTHASSVANGLSCVFSIRKAGRRMVTAEIFRDGRLREIKGKGNARVTVGVEDFALRGFRSMFGPEVELNEANPRRGGRRARV